MAKAGSCRDQNDRLHFFRVGELCIMNPVQQTVGNTGDASSMVHLTLSGGDLRTIVEDPERVMEEMWLRANQVSSVLENILREPHGEPRWGLNE